MEKTSLFLSVFLAILLIPIASAKPSITIISPLNQTYYNGTAPLNVSSNETVNITVRLNEAVFEWYNVSGVNTIVYGEETFLLNATVENENGTNYESLVFTVVDGAHSIDVTTCGALATQNETYILQNNLSDPNPNVECIIVTDNIVLDCQGYTINAWRPIYLDSNKNVTIENCNLIGDHGISGHGTNDFVNIYNTNATSYYSTFSLSHTDHLTVRNCRVKSSNFDGIYAAVSRHFLIENTTVEGAGRHGIKYSTIVNGTIRHCNITSSNMGLVSGYAPGYIISYNHIYDNYLNAPTPYISGGPYGEYLNTTRHSGQRIYTSGDIGGNYWVGYSDSCYDVDRDGFCDEPYNAYNNTQYGFVIYDYLPYSTCYGTTADWQVTVEKTQINSTHRMVNETYVDLTGCEPPYSVIRYEIHPILFNTIAFVMAAGFLLMLVRDFFAVDNPRNMINFLLAITIIFIVMVSAMQLLL